MSATSRRCLVKRRPFIQLAIISVVAAVNDGNAYYTATNDIQIYLTGRWRRKRSSIRAFEKKLFPSLHPFSSPFYLLPVFLFLSTLAPTSLPRRNSSSRKRILTGPAIESTRTRRMTTFYRKSCLFYPISGIPWSRYGRPSINTLRFLINILFSQLRSS